MSKKQEEMKELRVKLEWPYDINADILKGIEKIRSTGNAESNILLGAGLTIFIGALFVFVGIGAPWGIFLIIIGFLFIGVGVWGWRGKPTIEKIQGVGAIIGLLGILLIIIGVILVFHLFLTAQDGTIGAIIIMGIGAGLAKYGSSHFNSAQEVVRIIQQESVPTEIKELYSNISNFTKHADSKSFDDVIELRDENNNLLCKVWLIQNFAVENSWGIHFWQKDIFQLQEKAKTKKQELIVSYTRNGTNWLNAIINSNDFKKYQAWKNA